MIEGNITGVRKSILDRLELLFEIKTDKNVFADQMIVEEIAAITSVLNREVSVAIDRRGNVVEIAIGDSNTVKLPKIENDKRGLAAVRIIHTHPSGSSRLSDVDISALISLKLDAMIAIGVSESGAILDVTFGFCQLVANKVDYQMTDVLPLEVAQSFDVLNEIEACEKQMKAQVQTIDDTRDVALLVGTDTKQSLDELAELAYACEIAVVGQFFQKREKVDAKYFIGSGKVDELSLERQVMQANIVVFDDELTGVQLRNLEMRLGCRVIDRTMLILEIFARRAKTREAKIQVMIAKLKYERSRLSGEGVDMSRLGGGLGAKGSGETKLELDRRKIREIIHQYTQELKQIERMKQVQKQKRVQSDIPQIALVGYTNVGKSTLRNLIVDVYSDDKSIEKKHVLSENMLFATLSTTVRTFLLPDRRAAALVDTVGFIRKLPHDLVESFQSTLSEVIDADLIVHVIDSSSEDATAQIDAVNAVLKELDCEDKKQLIVLNKCDIATESELEKLKQLGFADFVEISAKSQYGIDLLLEKIAQMIPNPLVRFTIRIPYSESEKLSDVYKDCEIITTQHDEIGTVFEIMIAQTKQLKYQDYVLTDEK